MSSFIVQQFGIPCLQATVLLHNTRDLVGKFVSLGSSGRLCVHAASVLCTTGTSKRTSAGVLSDTLIDLVLGTCGMAEAALSIGRLEGVLVGNLDANEAVGEIRVGGGPVLESPALMGKNHLDHQHVRERIAHGLVDEIANSGKSVESVLLSRRLRLSLTESPHGILAKQHSAVAVGLEIRANIKLESSVVQVLDAGGCAHDGQSEMLLNVVGASTVCIGRLNNTDTKVIFQTSRSDEIADERSSQSRNTVAVQHEETGIGVGVVVDQAVGIAIEGAVASTRDGLGRSGCALLGLDKVCSALELSVYAVVMIWVYMDLRRG